MTGGPRRTVQNVVRWIFALLLVACSEDVDPLGPGGVADSGSGGAACDDDDGCAADEVCAFTAQCGPNRGRCKPTSACGANVTYCSCAFTPFQAPAGCAPRHVRVLPPGQFCEGPPPFDAGTRPDTGPPPMDAGQENDAGKVEETPCFTNNGVECTADEVCAAVDNFGGRTFECRAVPPACGADHSCACVGDAVCGGNPFVCVSAPEPNTVNCTCPAC